MKKLLSLLLCFCMFLSAVALLASCDNGNGGDVSTQESSTQTEESASDSEVGSQSQSGGNNEETQDGGSADGENTNNSEGSTNSAEQNTNNGEETTRDEETVDGEDETTGNVGEETGLDDGEVEILTNPNAPQRAYVGDLCLVLNENYTYDVSYYDGSANLTIPRSYENASITGFLANAFAYNDRGIDEIRYEGTMAEWCNMTFGTQYSNPMRLADKFYINGKSIESLTIPDTVKEIKDYAFCGASTVSEISLPDGLEKIGTSAFSQVLGITSITIPSSVTEIRDEAFRYCYKLVEIINKSDLTIEKGTAMYEYEGVGDYALCIHKGTTKLVNENGFVFITGDDGVDYLVNYVGDKSDITFPESYKGNQYKINQYAFYKNKQIKSVEFSGGVTEIGYMAFTGSPELLCARIGGEVTDIGHYAFSGCQNLMSVTLGASVESMWMEAFRDCEKLVEVINLTTMEFEIGSSEYADIAYNALIIHTGESKLTYIDNEYIFITVDNTNYLINYIGNDSELVLPSDYNGEGYVIHDNCFSQRTSDFDDDNYRITSVEIPDAVTGIGKCAFEYCLGLKTVNIGNGVKNIDLKAFYVCSSLEALTIGKGLETIGDEVFKSCNALEDIYYADSMNDFEAIVRESDWHYYLSDCTVHCSDGDIVVTTEE